MFARLGRFCFQRRGRVVIAWLLFLFLVGGLSSFVGSGFSASITVPDSETKDGFDLLEENFADNGLDGRQGQIVFKADSGVDDPEVQAAMEEMFAFAASKGGVQVSSPYEDPGSLTQVAPPAEDGSQVAFASLNIDGDFDDTDSSELGKELRNERPQIDGLQVEIGGQSLAEFEPPETEVIGLSFAIVILLVSFGSVLAMGLPIGTALAGVAIGGALTTLLSNVFTVPDFATFIGVMIGLGVGIDYALFIVTRYRSEIHYGTSNLDAVGIALDTAGRAVLFAGITVVVSLLGMMIIGLEFVSGLGIAAATTVAVTMVASITLVPALLGFAGDRIEVTRWRGLIAAGLIAVGLLAFGLLGTPAPLGASVLLAVLVLVLGSFVPVLKRQVPVPAPKPMRETFWYRLSRVVQRRPWQSVIGCTLILGILAIPLFGLRLGFSDEGNFPEDTTTRKAYDLVADAFGPGFNGPFIVAVGVNEPTDAQAVPGLAEAIAADPGVANASPALPNDPENPSAFVIRVVPTTSPQSQETSDLINRVRSDIVPVATGDTTLDVFVTGEAAASIDFSKYLGQRIPVFFAVVLALSFLLLMMVFRSLLVPLKAVIMNVLSIAAAYGVVVALFQWGWFGSITGIAPAPIEPFIPMMMFAIVFGLSMDYEVFLLSRVKEEYDRTGDPVESVADGLASTARVITAAAAIMVVVFGSFLLEDDRVTKIFGTGLAMAVFLDATLVRMLLVPATMELLGARNWWLPKWLDRILPNISVEGHVPHHEDADFAPDPGAAPDGEPVLVGSD